MMLSIELRNLQRRYKVDERMIKEKAKAILLLCGLVNTELGILIVNNKRIQRLNRIYRGIDRPTDVLSFPLTLSLPPIGRGKGEGMPGLLGDIVISMEMVHKQAEEQGHSANSELLFLLTHGILHLLGYDHEISPARERSMKRKESFILSHILSHTLSHTLSRI